jgi:ABC-2 type transport system permease protein
MREKVRAVIVIPPNFAKKLLMRQNVSVQVIIDGANANAANTSAGYISAVIQEFSLNVLAETMLRWGKGVITMPVDYRPRIWYNPELVSAKFLIPGLIAFIMMVTAVISTSLSIVREKERGTMEQIAVSPLKSSELIIGKTIPYVIISLFSSLMILLAGWILFGVAVKGSILLLFAVILIFLISCLAVGLLISSLVESQQLAFMLSVILTILPTFILSGFVFPIRNMPFVIQAISYIVPARYFLVALRAIIIKGVGIAGFWEQLLALVVITTIAMGAASARLRKKRL